MRFFATDTVAVMMTIKKKKIYISKYSYGLLMLFFHDDVRFVSLSVLKHANSADKIYTADALRMGVTFCFAGRVLSEGLSIFHREEWLMHRKSQYSLCAGTDERESNTSGSVWFRIFTNVLTGARKFENKYVCDFVCVRVWVCELVV